jgi:hypothetical protein
VRFYFSRARYTQEKDAALELMKHQIKVPDGIDIKESGYGREERGGEGEFEEFLVSASSEFTLNASHDYIDNLRPYCYVKDTDTPVYLNLPSQYYRDTKKYNNMV